jgi:hypothetical protein
MDRNLSVLEWDNETWREKEMENESEIRLELEVETPKEVV